MPQRVFMMILLHLHHILIECVTNFLNAAWQLGSYRPPDMTSTSLKLAAETCLELSVGTVSCEFPLFEALAD